MVPRGLFDQLSKGPLAYFDRSIPSFNPGQRRGGRHEGRVDPRRADVRRHAVRATGPWKIEQPKALAGRTADAQAVRGILGDLNRLTAREIVAEKAEPKDLATYNLAKPPVRVVVTLTKEGKPVPTTFDFGNEAGARGVYFKLGGKDAVYLVGNEALQPLKRELRDTAVFAFDPSKVAASRSPAGRSSRRRRRVSRSSRRAAPGRPRPPPPTRWTPPSSRPSSRNCRGCGSSGS